MILPSRTALLPHNNRTITALFLALLCISQWLRSGHSRIPGTSAYPPNRLTVLTASLVLGAFPPSNPRL